ncbi:nucleotide sugar dehydrogenase [Terriglobus aquaticus]|uniref:Nucleotide sugar dehydrogenase n=1 Tax=Terriglobus aquaticus TaxID=940139 RepID=A0ABW9KJI2_9BACT|nr:nucleotide sugar dehydrogenase [Terriglobus aquaticus]
MSATRVSSLSAPRLERLKNRSAAIGIIGLGYVGLPLSMLLAEAGFKVTGFDIDQKKVDSLMAGKSYIFRIPSEEIESIRSKGFTATADFSKLTDMDAIILCVPTPLNEHHEPDMSYIVDTAKMIAPWLQAGQLVALESTTYPGTTEEVLIPLLEAGNKQGLKVQGPEGEPAESGVFYVAFSPEREDPGNTTTARHNIPKVVGGHEPIAAELAATLYEGIFTRAVRVSTTQAAEMTKLLENIYRCVNIALVNEMKVLALRMGIDIWEVIDAAATKPFGFQAFYPGPGLGGHCIPIDPFYLSWKAKEFGFHTRFIELAGEVNEAMPEFVVAQVAKALNKHKKPLNGAKVLMLGMSYKKDIDDLRESPSLTLIELLRDEGAEVVYNDPYHPTVGRGRKYNLNMTSTPLENLGQYDCVLIATDHTDYDYARIVKESQLVVDSRNATKGIQADNLVRC